MTLYRYTYDPEFSCIIKLTESGEVIQRFYIQRCDLMELALVCWENSIDKLNMEKE